MLGGLWLQCKMNVMVSLKQMLGGLWPRSTVQWMWKVLLLSKKHMWRNPYRDIVNPINERQWRWWQSSGWRLMAHWHGCLPHDGFGIKPEAMRTHGKCLQQRRCIPPTVKSESWLCKLGGQHWYQTDSFLWCELLGMECDLAQYWHCIGTHCMKYTSNPVPSWCALMGLFALGL